MEKSGADQVTKKNNIDYALIESIINAILAENQKPDLEKIKRQLEISGDSFDEIIDYYRYMWEQRHTTTYLETLEPLNPNEIQNKDFLKRTIQLEESLGMMRATIEATEDGLLMINNQGKLIGFNKKLVELVGLPESVRTSKDETEGLNYLFSQIADPQELAALVRKKYQDPTPGNCGEMSFRNGKVVERYYQPQIVNKQVVGHVWSLRDVTEKRKQEESLRLRNRAITASTHGIILFENNPEYTIIYLNPASLKLFNVIESSVVQTPLLKMIDAFSNNEEKFLNILQSEKKGDLTIQCIINGKILWVEINIDPVYEKDEKTISHFVSIIDDVTKNKELENILQYKAVHDALTGLPNKAYLEDAIRYRIKKALVEEQNFALLFIDIDRFKNINDTLGHGVGDQLLLLFGKRLQHVIQKQDIIVRIGGDEFIVLINDVTNSEYLLSISNRILESCRKKFTYANHEFNISASIGVVQYPECGRDTETLIRNADIAMYQAKFSGRNRVCLYTNSLNHTMSRRVEIENELHDAIKNNEFYIYYQPIYSSADKKFNKAEALIRWKNKKLGIISPTEFIAIAEDIGMMTSIGRWVISSAIRQIDHWHKQGITDLAISINVSAKQLLDEHFVEHITQLIHTKKITPESIILEITESFFLLEETVADKLLQLCNLGIKIAIDDFGTGYSNLNYLNKLHISYLKIDKSFIDQIDQPQFNDSVILAIIAIAKRMQFKIIAEGVETKMQYEFLLKNECDEIQGYYFSKPIPADELPKFIEKNNS
jgi:diguanylate cyclase (GGDEF)-like protein/PAS domain S-box-containing protein